MTRTNTTVSIDAEIKEIAITKGINLSQTLEDSLVAELEIVDKKPNEQEEMISKLKNKCRKLLEIHREDVRKTLKLQGIIDHLEVKKEQNHTGFVRGETIADLKNDPERYGKITQVEKKQVNAQYYANPTTPKTGRADIERRKMEFLKGHKDQIANVIKEREKRLLKEAQKAGEEVL